MARTKGASHRFHQDDGVVLGRDGALIPVRPVPPSFPPQPTPAMLDRQGHYISPAAARLDQPRALNGDTVLTGPGTEPAPAQRRVIGYRASPASWGRNMEAFELAGLLDLMLRNPGDLGAGFVVDLSPAEFSVLRGDLKQHFRPVYEEAQS